MTTAWPPLRSASRERNWEIARMATCRKCGSTNIQAMKRGYTLTRGLFGMSDIITVCLDCGHKSQPGGTPWEQIEDRSA